MLAITAKYLARNVYVPAVRETNADFVHVRSVNAAVATLGAQRTNPALIASPRVGSYPPSLPAPPSPSHSRVQDTSYLPVRELCDHYVQRFLIDVHCTYWLYPVESLLRRVDDTYSATSPTSSSSWMCSLYCIFAVGAANYSGTNGNPPPPEWAVASDQKTSEDYIALAKQLIPAVYDEADLDSLRAMAILVGGTETGRSSLLMSLRASQWRLCAQE